MASCSPWDIGIRSVGYEATKYIMVKAMKFPGSQQDGYEITSHDGHPVGFKICINDAKCILRNFPEVIPYRNLSFGEGSAPSGSSVVHTNRTEGVSAIPPCSGHMHVEVQSPFHLILNQNKFFRPSPTLCPCSKPMDPKNWDQSTFEPWRVDYGLTFIIMLTVGVSNVPSGARCAPKPWQTSGTLSLDIWFFNDCCGVTFGGK